MNKITVDIIGAGIGGLACAYYLHRTRPDVHLRIWEKDPFPGGLAGAFDAGGFTLEKFYHHIFKRDKALIQLLKDLKIEHHLHWLPATSGFYFQQQTFRLSAPWDILTFGPLPWPDRLRLLKLMLAAQVVNLTELEVISARDWVIKQAGTNVWTIVWEPLFNSKFGAASTTIAASWLVSKLRDRGHSRNRWGQETLGFIDGSFGVLFERLVDVLRQAGHEIYFNQPVKQLTLAGDRVVTLSTAKEVISTQWCIAALQTPELKQILPISTKWSEVLEGIIYLGNVCLVLELEKPLSDFYWTNITDRNAPFVGVIEHSNWVGVGQTGMRHLAYLSAYAPLSDERFNMTSAELLNHYFPYLKKMFPDLLKERILRSHVWRASFAQPVIDTNYRRNIPAINTPFQNLFLCSMAQIYPHDRQVNNGIVQALKTVEMIKPVLA